MLRYCRFSFGIVLVAANLIGGSVVGLFSGEPNLESSGPIVVFGFLLFAGSIVGFLVLLVSFVPRSMTREQVEHWARVRARGKLRYMRNFVLLIVTPAMFILTFLVFAWPAFGEIPTGELVRNYAVLLLVLAGCMVLAASAFWHENERQYQEFANSKDQRNEGRVESRGKPSRK